MADRSSYGFSVDDQSAMVRIARFGADGRRIGAIYDLRAPAAYDDQTPLCSEVEVLGRAELETANIGHGLARAVSGSGHALRLTNERRFVAVTWSGRATE